MLVFQRDLYITHIGSLAQIVLTYQTIKANGRRRAGIDLRCHHFVNAVQLLRHSQQGRVGFFQSGAFRHIQHQLDFALVIKGQHFQHHRFDHRQPHYQHDQANQTEAHQVTLFTAGQQRRHDLAKEIGQTL